MTNLQISISWLQRFSIETWDRICFTRHGKRGSIFETTITQNLLFQLYRQFRSGNIPFEVWEAKDEAANGNDIEFAVETTHGYILLPCQAKIVKSNNRYSTIDHSAQGRLQIEALLAYARKVNGWAMYLFYNYCTDSEHNLRCWQGDYRQMAAYGCSLLPAEFLYETFCPHCYITDRRKWEIPTFQELHPLVGRPLHGLVALLLNSPMKIPSNWLPYYPKGTIKFYSYKQLEDIGKWNNLTPPPRISGIQIVEKVPYEDMLWQEDQLIFNPRYRILVPLTKRGTIVRRW